MSAAKPVLTASVRDVVEFVLRTGDLGGSGRFAGRNRALEGVLGHQRVQKSRPAGYEAEVPVRWQSEQADFIFELKGRIDGVLPELGSVLIEEIKTVRQRWTGPADPLHWGQARIYGCLYALAKGIEAVTVRITYLELATGETLSFEESSSAAALTEFFERVVGEYLRWLGEHSVWRRQRDESIRALAFPHASYRPGQRDLAVAAYRALKSGGRLFAEAPTGIGKTISVLFPTIKAMGEGRVEKVFYLTAKTVGRTVAEEALATLRSAGLRFRAVTLTAREKVCLHQGLPCDPSLCPLAVGYYDRIKAALREAFSEEVFTRECLERIAQRHQVCPFELSLDLSVWADGLICDYNYVFAPTASLKRYFDDEKHAYAILVDEAHNLLDRAREMFSAELSRADLNALKKATAEAAPAVAKALGRLTRRMAALTQDEGWIVRKEACTRASAPEDLEEPLEAFLEQAELWLAREEQTPFREDLLGAYFLALGFQRILEIYDDRYVTIVEDGGRLRLFCLDPARQLARVLKGMGTPIFFSATLRPGNYFREVLGGEPLDPMLQLGSPFPPDNLAVLVQDQIPTRLDAREASGEAVAAAIAALVEARTGNYLVFFPSYAYLAAVLARFQALRPEIRVEAQSPQMDEAQRQRFMELFQSEPSATLVAFAVLGGVFGEGIDLVGERLIGVVVVGVGLPQICLERELIREHCQARSLPGFDYAYTFPGANRVLQAAGRLIRTESDRGIVLLIDERFRRAQYRQLLPQWWSPRAVRSPETIRAAANEFWRNGRLESMAL